MRQLRLFTFDAAFTESLCQRQRQSLFHLMLVLGGTRKARGFGKVASLVGLVYNGVTGFFSDALSYVRLMALMLAMTALTAYCNLELHSILLHDFILL